MLSQLTAPSQYVRTLPTESFFKRTIFPALVPKAKRMFPPRTYFIFLSIFLCLILSDMAETLVGSRVSGSNSCACSTTFCHVMGLSSQPRSPVSQGGPAGSPAQGLLPRAPSIWVQKCSCLPPFPQSQPLPGGLWASKLPSKIQTLCLVSC